MTVGSVVGPFFRVTRALVRLLASLVGWLAGFVLGAAEGGQRPVSEDMRIPRPEWGPDLRMMDDEFL